jgi:hypothetical protein
VRIFSIREKVGDMGDATVQYGSTRDRLSDSERAVMAAARPLDPDLRDPFLRSVANALQGQAVIGPGSVARVCAQVQGEFFSPAGSLARRPRG